MWLKVETVRHFLMFPQIEFQQNIWSGGLWDKFTWKRLLLLVHKLGCIMD
jgi:hypothetical protein